MSYLVFSAFQQHQQPDGSAHAITPTLFRKISLAQRLKFTSIFPASFPLSFSTFSFFCYLSTFR
jgi:hypothetical protein